MTLSAWGYSVILALMVGVAAFALLNRAIVIGRVKHDIRHLHA